MELALTSKQFRRLLDLAYVGNWILNSARGEDRIRDYDEVESLLFAKCKTLGWTQLFDKVGEELIPSRAFAEGGIHEAIMDYEDTVFFEILAEELARRDMVDEDADPDDMEDLTRRMSDYIAEFERNGCDNISVNP